MKKIVVLLLLVILTVGVYAETSNLDGFKGLKWGSSKADIIKKEGNPVSTYNNNLAYRGSIANKQAIIIYEIVDDKLQSGMYIFDIDHVNKNLYIDDFEGLKSQLIKKYGEPTSDKIDWSRDLYKDDPSDWGRAISYGDLKYTTIWKLETTSIILSLDGDNYEINLLLMYLSQKHAKTASDNIDENL